MYCFNSCYPAFKVVYFKTCEINTDNTKTVTDYYYAQPVLYLKKCFNTDGLFDKSLKDCFLKDIENSSGT